MLVISSTAGLSNFQVPGGCMRRKLQPQGPLIARVASFLPQLDPVTQAAQCAPSPMLYMLRGQLGSPLSSWLHGQPTCSAGSLAPTFLHSADTLAPPAVHPAWAPWPPPATLPCP